MDAQRQEGQEADGLGEESLNTSSTNNNQESNSAHHNKGGIHNNALFAAGMGRAATAQVDPHSSGDLANTGTNISYEGPTAAGGGGSAGTGYTSGQADTGAKIAASSDYDLAGVGIKHSDASGDDLTDAENEINEQR